jgi:hypothetical protein
MFFIEHRVTKPSKRGLSRDSTQGALEKPSQHVGIKEFTLSNAVIFFSMRKQAHIFPLKA